MSNVKHIETIQRCYHCGEPCDTDLVTYHDHHFCCEGCKAVYSLLNEHDLCTYYNLNDQPGATLNGNGHTHFEVLDDSDVASELIDYRDEDQTKITFYVPNIHCSSCVWLLERLPVIMDAVRETRVDFLNRSLHVTFDTGAISVAKLAQTLSSIGYAPDIELGKQQDNGTQHRSNRSLYVKLGVAGFVFGNVMLFSLPSYFDHQLSDSLHQLFAGLSMVLSLPAMFYSGVDYFKAAWASIRQKRVLMDVPIALGMSALFLYSVYDVIVLNGTGYFDSLTGLVFFLLIGKVVQQKTYDRLSFERDYRSYFPISILRATDNGDVPTPIQKLDKGDLIHVRKGELIPCDCELESEMAQFDFSFVTGESRAVEKNMGELIYAGGRLLTGSARATVKHPVDQSYLTQLWNREETKNRKSTITWSDRISPWFTFAVLFIAATSGIYWWIFDPSIAVFAMTSVLIIACPCALAMSLPFVNNAMLNIFSRNGLFLKSGEVIQRLTEISHIFVDKTGTLTLPAKSNVQYHGKELPEDVLGMIYTMTEQSLHPLSRSIYTHLSQSDSPINLNLDLVDEIDGRGLIGRLDGKGILLGSSTLLEDFGVDIPEQDLPVHIDGSVVYVVHNFMYLGYFQLEPIYRTGIDDAFKQLHEQGFTLELISGDHSASEHHFKTNHPWFDELHYGKHPEEKLNHILKAESNGQHTLMLGDGLNDAGALKASHAGLAVTDDVLGFTPASDGILNAQKIAQLHQMINLARRSKFLVFSSYGLSFLYNFVGIWFAAQGLLSPVIAAILMPLSSISVILFATLSSQFTARFTLK